MAFGSLNFLVLIDTTQHKLISTFYPSDLTGKCSFYIYYDTYSLVIKMEKSRIFLTKCVGTACLFPDVDKTGTSCYVSPLQS